CGKRQLPTPNCQLPTANCQAPTPKSQSAPPGSLGVGNWELAVDTCTLNSHAGAIYALEYFAQSALIRSTSLGTAVTALSSPSSSADMYPLYPPWTKSFQTRSRSIGWWLSPKRSRMWVCVANGTHASICRYWSSSDPATKFEMSRFTPANGELTR